MEKRKQETKPDFVGVGAQRAGTSWLYYALNEHPEIFLPKKEVQFFNRQFDKGVDWYFSLFETDLPHKVTGEFTPDYLSAEHAMLRLQENCPDSKIIVMLRNPFERSYSAFNLYKSHGRFEDKNFQEAIETDPGIINKSMYFEQIKRLFSLFPKENIRIYDFDDVSIKPLALVKDVYGFIGVNDDFVPARIKERFNVGGNAKLQNLLNLPKLQQNLNNNSLGRQILKLKRFQLVVKIKERLFNQEQDQNVKQHFDKETKLKIKNDLKQLEKLMDKDFSKWY